MTPEPVVHTATGAVRGSRAEGLLRFLGIAYAMPPLGDLRFRPPVPMAASTHVRDATGFGAASAQVYDIHEGAYEDYADDPSAERRRCVGSEDSLTLNIWTPGLQGVRPVLVYIHGGANWLESSRLPLYHGDALVERGNVVYVSLNYRLGIFGFLDLSVLGGERYAGSHANGLRDQLCALQWIKANIHSFGGDPDNITLIGESAGSMDISWLLTNGRLDALVRRVVMMSGVASVNGFGHDHSRSVHSLASGREAAAEFLRQLHVHSMSQLLGMSTEEILQRHADVAARSSMLFDMDTLFYPRVEAPFTPHDPFTGARRGQGAKPDVMIGFTAYEMSLWLAWDDMLDQRSAAWAAAQLRHFPASQRDAIAALYDAVLAERSPGQRGLHLLSDAMFVMPAFFLADEISRHNPNIWMYQFDWPINARWGAAHATDLLYLFDKLDSPTAARVLAPPRDDAERAARQSLAHAMMDAVLAFATHGDPNAHTNAALPQWPRYHHSDRAVLRLNLTNAVAHDHLQARRAWWADHIYNPAMKT